MAATPPSISLDVAALASAMDERRKALPPKNNDFTIARVPAYVRARNKQLYEPMTIAIGPYHHDKPHLQAMEDHKWQHLQDLFGRSQSYLPGPLMEQCLSKINGMEEEARNSYSERIELKSDQFVKMMLLDGCFIIESFLKHQDGISQGNNMGWGLKLIDMDLLLLENQIPYSIIKALYTLIVPVHEDDERQLIASIYKRLTIDVKKKSENPPDPPKEIYHLLHLYYHWYVPTEKPSKVDTPNPWINRFISLIKKNRFISPVFDYFTPGKYTNTNNRISRVTELREAGVSFREKKSSLHRFDITFSNGRMEIPCINIEDPTKPILSNLIAFEQSIHKEKRTLTSFSWLMDSLINTSQDVAILQRNGIINNTLGSEEQVARFFNHLCEYTLPENNHYFAELFEQVNCYYNNKWHRHRARLMHDYFGNPWALISLAAASVLLFLTFMQTFFGIFAYFVPND